MIKNEFTQRCFLSQDFYLIGVKSVGPHMCQYLSMNRFDVDDVTRGVGV